MTTKPYLLIINPGPAIGKPSFEYYNLLSERFAGHVFITSGNPTTLKTKKIGNFFWHCVRFNEYFMSLSRLNFILFSLFFCIKLRINRIKIDLVVTYDPLITGLLGWICACLLNTMFSPEVNGVYTSPATFLDDHDNLLSRLKRIIYPVIESFVLQRSTGIKLLFPNQLASLKINIENKIIHSFPCHVTIDPFLNYKENEDNKEILFVGFPFKLKGVDILISAFKIISEKYNEWNLKILGWFSDPKELQAAVAGHPKIQVHPPVYFPEMPKHICKCGIFILPSRSEAMGRVLVEAMAAAKPRIGADVDGIPTVINDGIDGLLFEKENTIDLAHKIDLLISNPDLRIKMGQAGKERAQREFSSRVYFDNVIRFYNEILK